MTRQTAILLVGAGRFAEEVADLAADAGVEVAAWIEGLDPERAEPAIGPRSSGSTSEVAGTAAPHRAGHRIGPAAWARRAAR